MIAWFADPLMVNVLLFLLLVLIGTMGGWLTAQAPDDLAKEINSELRAAQNMVFSGKIEDAAAKVAVIVDLMGQLKQADPDSPKLKIFQPKLGSPFSLQMPLNSLETARASLSVELITKSVPYLRARSSLAWLRAMPTTVLAPKALAV